MVGAHNSTWCPFSMEKADEAFAGFSSEDRWKVLRGNAERVFAFTPAEPPSSPPRRRRVNGDRPGVQSSVKDSVRAGGAAAR